MRPWLYSSRKWLHILRYPDGSFHVHTGRCVGLV